MSKHLGLYKHQEPNERAKSHLKDIGLTESEIQELEGLQRDWKKRAAGCYVSLERPERLTFLVNKMQGLVGDLSQRCWQRDFDEALVSNRSALMAIQDALTSDGAWLNEMNDTYFYIN